MRVAHLVQTLFEPAPVWADNRPRSISGQAAP